MAYALTQGNRRRYQIPRSVRGLIVSITQWPVTSKNPLWTHDLSAPIRSHLDDLLHQVLLDLFYCDVWGVLDRDDNCVHTHGDHSPMFDAVLHCNLVREMRVVRWE